MLFAFQPLVYVQITPQHVMLKNLKTQHAVTEVAEIAVSLPPAARTVLGVGAKAHAMAAMHGGKIYRPFAHPRSLLSDLELAEVLLRLLLARVQEHRWSLLKPLLILHPLGTPEGGFTPLEMRALRELGLGAGAAQVRVWTGRALHDDELLASQASWAQGIWT